MYAEDLIEEALAEIQARDRDHDTGRCVDQMPKFWDEARNYVQYGVRRRSHDSALANAEGWMGIYPVAASVVHKELPDGVNGDYPPPPCGHKSEYVWADGCQCCEHAVFAQAYPGLAELTNAKDASISLWLIPSGYACAAVPNHAETGLRTGGRHDWHDVDMDTEETMSRPLRKQNAGGRRADEGDPILLEVGLLLRPGRYGGTAYPNGTDSPQVLLVHDTRRGSPSAIRIAIDYTPNPDADADASPGPGPGPGPRGAVRHTGTLLPASPECPALGWAIRWDDPAWLGEARVGLSFTLEADPTQSPFLYLVWVCEMPEGVGDPPGEVRIVSTVGKREHGWAPCTELTSAECAALGIGRSEAEMEMEAARAWYRREEYGR